MNEKRLGGCLVGFLYRMLIPKFIKGIVKSTASSLSEVTVKSAIARSNSYTKSIFIKNINIGEFNIYTVHYFPKHSVPLLSVMIKKT
jgi:hypothetical protein